MRIYLQLDEHSREVISGYVKKLATAITADTDNTMRKDAHRLFDRQLDAEKKDVSASSFGSLAMEESRA